jgi:glycosyltransferase involved in cell wall biosynthesis
LLIAAVIPAYNEEKTIGRVIEVLKKVVVIDEIIVVSDGSVDRTAEIAFELGAQVIELKQNIGKGGAMKIGIEATNADIILFLDADLIGLQEEHIFNLLLPVIEDKADMTIGVFGGGRVITDLAHKFAPFLSGQRAVKREILDGISDLDLTKFGVEVALTRYVINNNFRIEEVELFNLTHTMKEEKLGIVKGFAARLRMYWEIAKWVGRLRG